MAYVGPADIYGGATPAQFFSTRAYSTAKAATAPFPCMDVKPLAGGATTTINILSNGFIDYATLAGITNPICSKFYNQVGTNHLVQATTGLMPRVVIAPSGLGANQVALQFTTTSGEKFVSSSNLSLALPWSQTVFAKQTTTNQAIPFYFGWNTGGAAGVLGWNSSGDWIDYNGNPATWGTNERTSFHGLGVIVESTGLSGYGSVDATSSGNLTNGNGYGDNTGAMLMPNASSYDGFICEGALWSGNWTQTQLNTYTDKGGSATNGSVAFFLAAAPTIGGGGGTSGARKLMLMGVG